MFGTSPIVGLNYFLGGTSRNYRDDGVDFNCASIVCLDERKAWMRSTRCRSC
ncbi:hypothetical protein Pyn_37636 [Prunus yedoensis var. nudiflora]|uniref:Uncharacterized protein n=1 Tax=Prunus yedoensis var. nudiflora TaxID=2094558 RepID=A0A314Z9U2_PRUYE|nr:hypothetical protein Pyn_25016 [Prunus yedoensis var. nudiflora]PQQ18452.1 hypothetical protein Pyn_37636 [Prunus yedoensis var. nudiflora]